MKILEVLSPKGLFLAEDLGNLKQLGDKAVDALFGPMFRSSKKVGSDRVGRDSEIKVTKISGGGTAIKALDDKSVAGIVAKDKDGKVIFGISRPVTMSSFSSTKGVYSIYHPTKAVADALNKYGDSSTKQSPNAATKAAREFMKIHGKDMEWFVVKVDVERQRKQSERKEAKKGRAPTPSEKREYQKYLSDLKQDFKARAQKWLKSKAKAIESIEDMVDLLNEEGFLDKVVINGIPYERQDDQLRISSLKSKEKWHSSNAIEYRADWDDTYKKREVELKKLEKEGIEGEEAYEKAGAKYPRSVKVIFGIDKMQLVIQKVEPVSY